MISVIIPTLNSENSIHQLLTSLREQSIHSEIIVIDSSSADKTVKIAQSYGAKTVIIELHEFDHGTTRQMGVDLCGDAEILAFLTQDAVLADKNSLDHLLSAFDDAEVGAAYGRQLPRKVANSIEAHARLFNYPSVSQIKSIADVSKIGIKTAFISNAFAAYRHNALQSIGGFPVNTILNEDTLVAAKLLLAGWKIAYCANAEVFHSHNYSPIEEFRRYFDIGVFHSREPWIRRSFGQAEGEGIKYVLSELKYLWNNNAGIIPSALLRTFLKLLGYKLGLVEQKIPIGMKIHLSMNKQYWKLGKDRY